MIEKADKMRSKGRMSYERERGLKKDYCRMKAGDNKNSKVRGE